MSITSCPSAKESGKSRGQLLNGTERANLHVQTYIPDPFATPSHSLRSSIYWEPTFNKRKTIISGPPQSKLGEVGWPSVRQRRMGGGSSEMRIFEAEYLEGMHGPRISMKCQITRGWSNIPPLLYFFLSSCLLMQRRVNLRMLFALRVFLFPLFPSWGEGEEGWLF